ncbi:MAG: MqnA/MqnD/SBP family protein [Lachnospiraceae bacterium]|nr:MqnA/MqnD/SBP family protein [Lachnospiraceae bacterium]
MKFKSLRLLSALVAIMLIFTACTSKAPETQQETNTTQTETKEETKTEEPATVPEEKANINIAVLKGPTGLGALKLMEDNDAKTAKNNYNFTISAAPDEVTGKVISGEIDIAAVPTNLAATLYNKTEGKIKLAALNTLGMLYVLENGNTINSIADLAGKTIYSSGQGATPEYALNYILEQNGIENVTVEYKAEHAELATAVAAGEVNIAVLPEPNVTAVLLKKPDIRIALDLTEEWNKISEKNNDDSVLSMGCIIVRTDFLENNKEAFDTFLDEYKASIEYVTSNVEPSATLAEKYGILASAAAAKSAIPKCNIVYIDGSEIKDSIENFYNVLFEANPKSVGGTLPDENFYYSK